MSEALYIVATPIGNIEDITLRALRVLREVDLIAAEDTRHSGRLLKHYDITTPLISLHDFNEKNRAHALITRLKNGEKIALISDAGTPLISDPGYILVNAVRAAGLSVVPIPGACALIAALSSAGLPTDRFVFEGFLSAKSGERRARLQMLCDETRTLIFYEAPHRILKLCRDISEVLGEDRLMVITKELTKTFETFFAGSSKDAVEWLEKDPLHQKGEFVVLLHGASHQDDQQEKAHSMLKILSAELPTAQAVALAAKITGVKKNALYAMAISERR